MIGYQMTNNWVLGQTMLKDQLPPYSGNCYYVFIVAASFMLLCFSCIIVAASFMQLRLLRAET